MASSPPVGALRQIQGLAGARLKGGASAAEHPTIAESGMTGFDFSSWYGLWGPKGLPANVTAKLQAEVAKALAQGDFKDRLGVLGFEAIGSTAAEFGAYIDAESTRYGQIIRDAKIKTE